MIKGLSVRNMGLALLTVATCSFFPIGGGLAAPSYEIIQNGGAGASNIEVQDSKLSGVAMLELSRTPDEGYYFKGWHVAEGAQAENETNQAGATVVLPDAHIGITAEFGEIGSPVISADPVSVEYTGGPIAIQPVIENGVDLAPEHLTVLYTKLPDGIPTAEAPTEIGDYHVSMSFAGNAQNNPVYVETAISIGKMNMAARPADVMSAEADRVTFFTEYGQRYLVLASDDEFPTKATSGWMDGFGDNHTWENLQKCKKYIIYTYAIDTPMQTESEIIMTEFYTEQYFQCEMAAVNNDGEELAFTLAENENAIPEPLVITMTNTGVGPLKNVQVKVEGDSDQFNVDTGDIKPVLFSGESNTVTIIPVLGAPNGNYSANISMSAIGVEGGYSTPTLMENLDISYTVYEQKNLAGQYYQDNSAIIVPTLEGSQAHTEEMPQISQQPLSKPVNADASKQQYQTIPLQQPSATPAAVPVIKPVVMADIEIPEATTTSLIDWQESDGLIAALNAASDMQEDIYTDYAFGSNGISENLQGNTEDEQTPAAVGATVGAAGLDDIDDMVAIASNPQQAGKGETKRPVIKRVSALVWFYGLILLAAVIFTMTIFYFDAKSRKKSRTARAKNNGPKRVAGRPDGGSASRQHASKQAPHIIPAEVAK